MKNPVHPGAILREDVLGQLGVSVSDAAERLGVSRVTLSRVINEHARISPNLALRLEAAGISTARAWLAMQSACELAKERAAGMPKVRKLGTARQTSRYEPDSQPLIVVGFTSNLKL